MGVSYRHALDAAGIQDPALRSDYALCRQLHARYGRTYHLATLLLPPGKRPFVNALYGFARYADEIVDTEAADSRERHFQQWSQRALQVLADKRGADPVTRAMAHTMDRWDIPLEYVQAFLESMEADLTRKEYPTFEDLDWYMYGSAAVIGLQMVPILEPLSEEAYPRAEALGKAFQLANFIRDVAEDLRRGRIYLPLEDLDKFDVTPDMLARPTTPPQVKELLRYEINRTRDIFAYAVGGIRMLHPSSRPCIETAYILYGGILDAVEEADYEVLQRRVAVSLPTRIRTALPAYLQARRLWRDRP